MEVLRKHNMVLTEFRYYKDSKDYKFEVERIKQDETDSGRGEVQNLSEQGEEGDNC
jgi:hypothetical protein